MTEYLELIELTSAIPPPLLTKFKMVNRRLRAAALKTMAIPAYWRRHFLEMVADIAAEKMCEIEAMLGGVPDPTDEVAENPADAPPSAPLSAPNAPPNMAGRVIAMIHKTIAGCPANKISFDWHDAYMRLAVSRDIPDLASSMVNTALLLSIFVCLNIPVYVRECLMNIAASGNVKLLKSVTKNEEFREWVKVAPDAGDDLADPTDYHGNQMMIVAILRGNEKMMKYLMRFNNDEYDLIGLHDTYGHARKNITEILKEEIDRLRAKELSLNPEARQLIRTEWIPENPRKPHALEMYELFPFESARWAIDFDRGLQTILHKSRRKISFGCCALHSMSCTKFIDPDDPDHFISVESSEGIIMGPSLWENRRLTSAELVDNAIVYGHEDEFRAMVLKLAAAIGRWTSGTESAMPLHTAVDRLLRICAKCGRAGMARHIIDKLMDPRDPIRSPTFIGLLGIGDTALSTLVLSRAGVVVNAEMVPVNYAYSFEYAQFLVEHFGRGALDAISYLPAEWLIKLARLWC